MLLDDYNAESYPGVYFSVNESVNPVEESVIRVCEDV